MRGHKKIMLILMIGTLFSGCGASEEGAGGTLAVVISGAKSFNPAIAHGRIERYVVRIEGPGIASPLEATFPGDATEGAIDNVPVGADRLVSVIAANANKAVIRAGEEGGVEIGDGLTAVEVRMDAVPIFTNVGPGATVDNTRLVFRLFSDPGHPVVVEEGADDAAAVLADASTESTEVLLDAATGLGRLAPRMQSPGQHVFRVRDLATGRASVVEAMLLDGTRRRPAPFVAAAAVDVQGVGEFSSVPGAVVR